MGLKKITNRIIWGAVVYPAALEFLGEYLQSVDDQDDDDFELFILNDGVKKEELDKLLKDRRIRHTVEEADPKANPIINRIRLIKDAKNMGAGVLIIGDSDDTFSLNRVRLTRDAYATNPDASFFYNDLLLMDGSRATPPTPSEIFSVKEISQFNFLGMSNTAINLTRLEDEFIDSLSECDSRIFDWYLHSRLLMNVGKGIKLEGAYTYYRIYGDNIAGVREFNEENLSYEVSVKKKHYEMLGKYDILFRDLLDKIGKIDIKEVHENTGSEGHYWWDLIKLEE